ncbi:FAD-dependent oxidoreductase [Sinorhizobium sp. BG8]|uniref:NAD(P)/FAD-dependent oxidoreductase n=1 Tax=Sinorhizobium sp. BG8 TaxID=2613773 RepID=UPI00193D6575|nr:FAD-dependent oxidoreductase [Sinorhizobium sp. BG8]QRM56375.1 FAD-binding oxidoreductase [Sinorhizobium sp. BG8]
MTNADSRTKAPGQQAPDVLVVGGGVMGLWAAVMAARRGLSVEIVDRATIGSGASGGVLGALMSHLPDRWNEKKQFQFDALVSLPREIAHLERETGLSAGYRRSGRLIPLPKPHLRDLALGHSRDAGDSWAQGSATFGFNVLEQVPMPGWPAEEVAACGLVHDELAARVAPRRLLALLRAALEMMPNVAIRENTGVARVDSPGGTAVLEDGTSRRFGHLVLAAGTSSFDLLRSMAPPLPRPLGVGVKGQAALFKAAVDPSMPVIFFDGLYIVPHEDGHVAVGSTSENTYTDPAGTDGQLEGLIDEARRVAPLLEKAEVVERWAGLRPKAIGRDPMAGRHPDLHNVSLLTGGFKISFGIAHELARAVIAGIENGSPEGLPPSFAVGSHLKAASRAPEKR